MAALYLTLEVGLRGEGGAKCMERIRSTRGDSCCTIPTGLSHHFQTWTARPLNAAARYFFTVLLHLLQRPPALSSLA
eukprot:6199904-Pleurochrysis_carterae.AAC.2